jgi:thiol-disulfide isomerase/thioredoxin
MARIHAPELVGSGGWLNTGGRPLSLAALRGRVVLLDFWTFCCVNCLHVLDELRELEARFGDELVVLGVHSPKFPHEADHAALRDAVERYGVTHPVLDDPQLATWSRYAVAAWPTLVLIDPAGYIVTTASGEGHGPSLQAAVAALLGEHRAAGTLRGAEPVARAEPGAGAAGDLRFPSRALALPDGTLLVADTGHHSVAVLDPASGTVLRRIGSGRRGRADGAPGEAAFAEPQGLALLPSALAAEVGYEVVVADTGNHLLRGVSLPTGSVRTVAGTGRPLRLPAPEYVPALQADLSSPWDVTVQGARLVVAMAGTHQLFSVDPVTERVTVIAGSGREGLLDGPAGEAALAQPSALAGDGARLFFLDAETSALRVLDDGVVRTLVGAGLFDFGCVDGPAEVARLQHPLGLRLCPDASLLLADTYNGALRRYDPQNGRLTTLLTGLAEPTDVVLGEGAAWVVESSGHRVTPVDVAALVAAAACADVAPAATAAPARPVTELAPAVRLRVAFTPPPGRHLDDRDGPAVRLRVEGSPPDLVLDGAGTGNRLERDLVLRLGEGVLSVTATAASCDDAGEHPACHLSTQDWGVPVRVGAGGSADLELVLLDALAADNPGPPVDVEGV